MFFFVFFFNVTATTEIYTLSLHDALPIYQRRSLLTAAQLEQLKARLALPPTDGGLWNGPKVARVIAELTGMEKVWPQRGWDYLKRLEQSLQVPRPRHRQGDSEAQAAFKKTFPSTKLN